MRTLLAAACFAGLMSCSTGQERTAPVATPCYLVTVSGESVIVMEAPCMKEDR